MKNNKYSIIVSSLTGNTKMLADAIYDVLPKENCDFYGNVKTQIPQSEMLYIGFWTDKGTADSDTLKLLQSLKNRKVFLFGTAGFGGSDEYFKKILSRVKQSLDLSNVVVGEYMCQGKMPQSVRERYVKMKELTNAPANLDMLIGNFDSALSHPDEKDIIKLKNAVISL